MSDYITVDDLAAQLDITDDADRVLLQSAVTAASVAVSSWCARTFSLASSATARTYAVDNAWTCPVDDFSTLTGLVVKTDSGDNGTFDQTWTVNTEYIAEPFNGTVDGITGWPYTQIDAVGSRYFPRSMIGSGRRPRVQVTAKWGWAAVPESVKQATKLKAARLFQRKDAVGAQGGFAGGGSGFSVPLIRVDVREDPDVVELLRPFVKTAGASGRFIAG